MSKIDVLFLFLGLSAAVGSPGELPGARGSPIGGFSAFQPQSAPQESPNGREGVYR